MGLAYRRGTHLRFLLSPHRDQPGVAGTADDHLGQGHLGFLVLTAFPVARRPVERTDYRRIALAGITWVAVPFLMFPIAQQHIDSALAGMLNAIAPIFSTSIAIVLTRSLPRLRQAVRIALGFAGAISINLPAARDSAGGAWGVLLVVVATLFYGLSLNLTVPLQQRYGAPAVMMRVIGVASVATAPFGLVGLADSQMEYRSGPGSDSAGSIQHGRRVRDHDRLRRQSRPYSWGCGRVLHSIVAMVLGVAFRSEVVLALQFAGIGLVLQGAGLTSRREG